MSEELTEEVVDPYVDYKHPQNGHYYVYITVPVAMLDLTAPADANNAKKDIVYDEETGEELSYELKTMREYLTLEPVVSVDGTTAICLLNEAYTARQKGVSYEDIVFWDEHLTEYGLGSVSGAWMTIEQARTLRETEEYSTQDVGA